MAEGNIEGPIDISNIVTNLSTKIHEFGFYYYDHMVHLYLLGKDAESYTNGEVLLNIPAVYRPKNNYLANVYNTAGNNTGNTCWVNNNTGDVTLLGNNPITTRLLVTVFYFC